MFLWFVTGHLSGQVHTEGEGLVATGNSFSLRPPKASYQLNGRQNIQTENLKRLISNDDPYHSDSSMVPTQNHHSVIFEPIQNIRFSRSVYRLTSIIDFKPHIRFFEEYEQFLEMFLNDMLSQGTSELIRNPHKVGSQQESHGVPDSLRNVNCSDPSVCETIDLKSCYQWFISICMNQKHYEQMIEDTQYIKVVFQKLKENVYLAINHVSNRTDHNQKQHSTRVEREAEINQESEYVTDMTQKEIKFVGNQLEDLVKTMTNNQTVSSESISRTKRLGIDTLILGGGILANRASIRTIQKNIKKIHEENKRQDRNIGLLSKFLGILHKRIKLHESFLHKLDVRMIRLEHDLIGLLHLSQYNSFTTYTLRDANYILTRLITGLTAATQNSESLYAFLRVMSTHKVDPTVIPVPHLMELMKEVEEDIKESPRLALPISLEGNIEEYYNILRISTLITEDSLIILLSIPLTDISLKMNLYRAHNLPAVHPTLNFSAVYQLEGEYLAIGQDGHYVALPDQNDVQICVLTRGGLCRMNQALYPVDKVKWCIYALYMQDEKRIQEDCRYDLNTRIGNLAHSLGGYLWAISAVATEKLQIRCLKRTHIVIIGPPLQIVYIGDGCEGYSPSISTPAKTELTSASDKPGRQGFFISFNSYYQANPLIGLWAKLGLHFISKEQANELATKFPKMEDINLAEIKDTIENLEEDTFEFPTGLTIGVMLASVLAVIIMITLFIWKVYQMKGTLNRLKDVPKILKEEPSISGLKKAGTLTKEVVTEIKEESSSKTRGTEIKTGILERAIQEEFQGDKRAMRKYHKALQKQMKLQPIDETDTEASN